MKIKSLRLYGACQPLNKLFQISGAIRNVVIISAYIDLDSIDQLIEYIDEIADTRGLPSLRIFIDKSSSHYLSDRETQKKFIKANKKIHNICDSSSGIFLVQLGALFHSKAYLIEGNKKAKILFGSMNLTQNGINQNEELILYEDINIGGKANGNRLATWIKEYADNLHAQSVQVGIDTSDNFPSCMRQLLLNGSIYYELKEQNPFRFKLYLPQEVVKQQVDIDPMIEASITDSVSLEVLLSEKTPFGLGIKLPDLGSSRAFWKKYCIETCYGFWNPQSLRDDLKTTLKKRITERQPYFDFIKKKINEEEKNIINAFLGLRLRIQKYLESIGITDWKYSNVNVAKEAWGNWIENINNKIENDKYYDRLVSGVTSVPSPDVWNDPVASEEFEESFCESLLYYWSKEYIKETSNVVAQVFAWNLDLDDDEKDELDTEQLKNKIDEWLIENPNYSIIHFNEE